MTLYEILCAYRSEYWPNYQNLLDPKYDYKHERVEMNLPIEATDSYLGRLVSLALDLNKHLEQIRVEEIPKHTSCVLAINLCEDISARRFSKPMCNLFTEYLGYGLPAKWLLPFIEEYKFSLHTNKRGTLSLNKLIYLDVLRDVSGIDYEPVNRWFKLHPDSLRIETKYKE